MGGILRSGKLFTAKDAVIIRSRSPAFADEARDPTLELRGDFRLLLRDSCLLPQAGEDALLLHQPTAFPQRIRRRQVEQPREALRRVLFAQLAQLAQALGFEGIVCALPDRDQCLRTIFS